MRAGILKCLKISLFLSVFALFLCLSALSGTKTAKAATPEVKISVKSVSIVKGGSFTLKVYNTGRHHTVEFSSKDESIATVSPKGVISGVSCGTTVVVATVSDGKQSSELYCKVTIGPKPTGIKLTKSDLVLCVGSKKHLRVIIDPINTVGKPAFYSDNKGIASVSSSGVIRAKEAGTVIIKAYVNYGTPDEKCDTCTVTILSEEAYAEYLKEKDKPAESENSTGEDPAQSGDTTPTPSPEPTQPGDPTGEP